ncbi:MAG: response regulator [Sphingomonadaceae bacterium]
MSSPIICRCHLGWCCAGDEERLGTPVHAPASFPVYRHREAQTRPQAQAHPVGPADRAQYQAQPGAHDPTIDPAAALPAYVELAPDLVLLDLMMPGIDGFQLLEAFARHDRPDEFRPVLVLTADTTIQARRRALSLGAKDFVAKPFDVIEVALRISNLLETRVLYDRLRQI